MLLIYVIFLKYVGNIILNDLHRTSINKYYAEVFQRCTAIPKSKPKWPDNTSGLFGQRRPFPHIFDGHLHHLNITQNGRISKQQHFYVSHGYKIAKWNEIQ